MDRSKFKATNVATMKQQEKEVSKLIRKGDSERTDHLSLDEGTNKVRIFPSHPDSKSFIYPYGRWWLPKEVTYEKEGETITEIKKRPIYSAKIHGGAQKDVVEEYVEFAIKVFSDEITDESELKEKIEKLTHWKTGLKLKPEWVMYINKYVNGQKQFGLITISNGIKNKLNELAIVEDSDAPVATDPFTDPDEGKAIIITYSPKEKQAKDVYKAALEWRGDYSLTDAELETFSKLESLEKLFTNVYRRKDFDLAVAGIKMFDEENDFGIFEHDEFIEIVEELQKEWPEESTDDEEEDSEESTETEDDRDEFDSMDREQLKKYIAKNTIPLIVKKAMSDDEIRLSIREFLAESVEDEEVEEQEESETEESNDEHDSGEEKPMSAIEKARLKLGKK